MWRHSCHFVLRAGQMTVSSGEWNAWPVCKDEVLQKEKNSVIEIWIMIWILSGFLEDFLHVYERGHGLYLNQRG
jgi:hypothetical protein